MKVLGEKIVKEAKYILSGEIALKARFLGLDERKISDLAVKNGLYGQDGSGYSEIIRSYTYPDEDFQKVITAILDEADTDTVLVLDDY